MSDRSKKLLNAFDKLAVWAAIVATIFLTVIYSFLGIMKVDSQNEPILNLYKPMIMSLSVNLIPIFLLFIGSYLLFRNIVKIRDEEKRENLATDVAQSISEHIEIQLKQHSVGNHWVSHESLTNAIIAAFNYVNNPKIIRIYAFSTHIIQPVIRDLKINCQECRLLLYHSNSIDLTKLDDDQDLDLIPIEEWFHMKVSGFIENLDVRFHQFYPLEYFVILEDRALIRGNYLIRDDRFPRVDVQDPMYVNEESSLGKKLIDKYLDVFENLRNSKQVQEVNIDLICGNVGNGGGPQNKDNLRSSKSS